MQVLTRDLYTCQQTGVILVAGKSQSNGAVVHHLIPHKGDECMFWDMNNLRAVSKTWHDSDARREEHKNR